MLTARDTPCTRTAIPVARSVLTDSSPALASASYFWFSASGSGTGGATTRACGCNLTAGGAAGRLRGQGALPAQQVAQPAAVKISLISHPLQPDWQRTQAFVGLEPSEEMEFLL